MRPEFKSKLKSSFHSEFRRGAIRPQRRLPRPNSEFRLLTLIVACMLVLSCQAWAVRVKDIAQIGEIYEHQLIGYGLVVGLNGTGDGTGAIFTAQSVKNMLQQLGLNISANLKLRNVAAVLATATLPPFAKKGSKIDVLVSSLGDATSLQGGTLLLTTLQAPDGTLVAVAQGPLSIGGFSVDAGGATARKNHPTVGRIPNGGLIQREIPPDFGVSEAEGLGTHGTAKEKTTLEIVLHKPDFTTAARLASTIDTAFSAPNNAIAVDAATVRVTPQPGMNLVEFIASIENLDIVPDTVAKVVIDERTGTVVMGENVRISTVAVAHGNLNIEINVAKEILQPIPSPEQSLIQPTKGPRGRPAERYGTAGTYGTVRDKSLKEYEEPLVAIEVDLSATETGDNLMIVPAGVDIHEVVRALNTIGVTPRDMISILQAMKEAGALQAELIIM